MFDLNPLISTLVWVCLCCSLVLVGGQKDVKFERNGVEEVTLDIKKFLKVRCSSDLNSQNDIFFYFKGSVSSFVPQERQKVLFQVEGFNVARCFLFNNNVVISSREVMFYEDPTTGKILQNWQNPWTNETVPVVHVVNNPVQMTIGSGNLENNTFSVVAPLFKGVAEIQTDVLLTYPNPLYNFTFNSTIYARDPLYQAGEFFKYFVSATELNIPFINSAWSVTIAWNRISQWLPWMRNGYKDGNLIFSTSGFKLFDFADLSDSLKDAIHTFNLGIYKKAPTCVIAQTPPSTGLKSITSWTYFRDHFGNYTEALSNLNVRIFPLAEPASTPFICA